MPQTFFGFYPCNKLHAGGYHGCMTRELPNFEDERLDSTVDAVVLTDVAEQELMVQMTESLFSELAYCAGRGLIECDRIVERRLCEEADDLLFDARDGGVVSFADLQVKLGKLHKRLGEFIRRRFIYQEPVSVPTATFDMQQLKRRGHSGVRCARGADGCTGGWPRGSSWWATVRTPTSCAIGGLPNPENTAADISSALRRLGLEGTTEVERTPIG